MTGTRQRLRLVFGLVAALALLLGLGTAEPHPATAASSWDGSFDLYRNGTFTTQKSWLWCTAADVQIMRNIADGRRDHAKSSQQRYFTWMRAHNRYDLPLSAGVDPAGWTAGLRHFVDDRYRLVSSASFDGALRSAVQRMRATNLPVALAVSRGNHGWVLTGFSATADPAATKDFRVTSVRVVGPLWGLQSRSYGYDMKPNTSLSVAQLRHFFTPWWYAPTRMIWDGRYVSIQPVPNAPQPKPQIISAPPPVLPSAGPAAVVASSEPSASTAPSIASSPAPASLAPASEATAGASVTIGAEAVSATGVRVGGIVLAAVLGAAAIITIGLLARSRPQRRPRGRARTSSVPR